MNVDYSTIIISPDKAIREKLFVILKEYNDLELTSRRPDRAKTEKLLSNVKKFQEKLETPLNISRKNVEEIFCQESSAGKKMFNI